MFKRISDTKIIEGIKAQDEKILEWLYDNFYQGVHSHVVKNSGTPDDVPDIFQDAIVILYKQIIANSLNLTSDLKGYFYGVARNLWNNEYRKKTRTTAMDPEFDMADEMASEDNEDILFEKIISKAFENLKPDCRKILTLYSDGRSYQEIAEAMELKNEEYARRKKYLCKEALLEIVKAVPEYQEFLRFQK